MIAGASSSLIVNTFTSITLSNIDIVTSVGGIAAGFLDYLYDGKVNNVVWEI